jgi:hypothetical protein
VQHHHRLGAVEAGGVEDAVDRQILGLAHISLLKTARSCVGAGLPAMTGAHSI